MNEAQLVALGIAAIGGEKIVVILGPNTGFAFI